MNRDPIGELGGMNLYGFLWNGAVNDVDKLGLAPVVMPVLKALFSNCVKSLLKQGALKGVSKYFDKTFACGEVFKESKSNIDFSTKICGGIELDRSFTPVGDDKSLAAVLLECIWSTGKSQGLKKLLKGVTDPLEKKLIEKLLDGAIDELGKLMDIGDIKASIKVRAECTDKKEVAVTLLYHAEFTLDGITVPLEDKPSDAFSCGGLLSGAFKNMCNCCK